MANLRLYMESVDGRSPSQAGFSLRGGGRSVRNYFIGDDGHGVTTHTAVAGISELFSSITELLGAVHTHPDGKRLQRTLPMADPVYQWCMCENIGNIQGVGNPGNPITSNPFQILEAPTVDYYSLYPGYLFSGVTFTPRPYACLQDVAVSTSDSLGSLQYTNQEGVSTPSFAYAQEWLRFTDVETIPAGEYITAQAGQFLFDVQSGKSPDGISAGAGQLKMLKKTKTIKMTWNMVPYQYVETGDANILSYIEQGLGCINQYDWFGYPKGTLLFEAVSVNRYTPVVPTAKLLPGSTISFANQKLCDITFFFGFQNPTVGSDATKIYGLDSDGNRATPRAPTRAGEIQAGWNLVPYAHQAGWFYAKTKIPAFPSSDGKPLFPSFPFELLFTNPGIVA